MKNAVNACEWAIQNPNTNIELKPLVPKGIEEREINLLWIKWVQSLGMIWWIYPPRRRLKRKKRCCFVSTIIKGLINLIESPERRHRWRWHSGLIWTELPSSSWCPNRFQKFSYFRKLIYTNSSRTAWTKSNWLKSHKANSNRFNFARGPHWPL